MLSTSLSTFCKVPVFFLVSLHNFYVSFLAIIFCGWVFVKDQDSEIWFVSQISGIAELPWHEYSDEEDSRISRILGPGA